MTNIYFHKKGRRCFSHFIELVFLSSDIYNKNVRSSSPVLAEIKHLNLADIWKIKNPEKGNLHGVGKIVLKKVEFILVDRRNIKAQVVSADIRPAIIKSIDHLTVSLKILQKTWSML